MFRLIKNLKWMWLNMEINSLKKIELGYGN